MGRLREISQVRPLAGILTAQAEDLAKVRERLERDFGPACAVTTPAVFSHTDYYAREMGTGLFRQFLIFKRLQSPDLLPEWKVASNALEVAYGLHAQGGRRINVDPGYLAPGKLVLASTKDHEQRVYVRLGVYAEVTLRIRDGQFCPWPWTYPDYAQEVDFFNLAYQAYLLDLKNAKAGSPEVSKPV